MAKTKISEYDSTAGNNTDLDSINLSENVMIPSDLNNFCREIMAHLADMNAGTSAIQDTFTLSRSEERRVGKECRSRWSPYH